MLRKTNLFFFALLIPFFVLNAQESEVIFQIPLGKTGVSYELKDVPDFLPSGPSAFVIDSSGRFWIADAVGQRLLQYNSQGTLLNTIAMPQELVTISDFCTTDEGIFILDAALISPKVWHLDSKGTLINSYDSPIMLADGLSGVSYTPEDGLLLEQEGGVHLTQIWSRKQGESNQTVAAYSSSYQIDFTSSQSPQIKIGNQDIALESPHQIVGLSFLHSNQRGDFYIAVEEMANLPVIQVDQTIRHYNAQGKQVGLTRVPLDEQFISVEHSIALAPDNTAYALVTRPGHVEIRRLNFSSQLSPLFPHIEPLEEADSETISSERAISRDAIMNNASHYVNNSVYLNSSNVYGGSCSGRTKPRFIGGPATYSSVPYDWGGWDSVAAFNSYMKQNYAAGDIHTSGVESCSRGTDCSGFVTRAWGCTNKKYGTVTLHQISNQLGSVQSLKRGDIVNKQSSHVRLFAKFANNGAYYYEATTGGHDRVIYRYLSWSSQNGYVPRRYIHVSDNTPPTPPTPGQWPTHSTTQNKIGPNIYAIQYLLRQHGQSLGIDGEFGPETKSKVSALQSSYGLKADGVVNETTWRNVLIKTVSQGSKGDSVRAVQYLLRNKFGHSLGVDGIFGSGTRAAVIQFQNSKGLAADGIVGPNTWRALVRL